MQQNNLWDIFTTTDYENSHLESTNISDRLHALCLVVLDCACLYIHGVYLSVLLWYNICSETENIDVYCSGKRFVGKR